MEVTREQIQNAFPHGAWFIQDNDNERAILVGPFEFDAEDESLLGTAWAHPNKAFSVDFSTATEEENGWRATLPNDLEVFIRPANEANWASLKPQLEY